MNAGLLASSAHDRHLVSLVAPPDHVNPAPHDRYDLVAIGGGTAGLVAAIGAGVIGARIALVERALVGGDCLSFGCVPSKALVAASRAARNASQAGRFGLRTTVDVDFAAVMESLRETRARVAPHDAVSTVESYGVQVFRGAARFVGRDMVEVGDARLRFRRALVATGTRAAVPDVPGLADAGYLTNESIFALTVRPRRLAIIGGGPIGCELGQAFGRLGSEVTILQRGARLLPREDADVSAQLLTTLQAEGVRVCVGADVVRVEQANGVCIVHLKSGATIEADALLVSAGRTSNVEALALDRAGVETDDDGVVVDDRLRTTNARIFAAGDVASRYRFTHAADAQARIALANALFFGRKKSSRLVIPWCTFTDPAIAHVGIGEEDARRVKAETFVLPVEEIDRAITERTMAGLVRVHVDRRGRLLGATVVGEAADELVGAVSIAMTCGLTLADLGRAIVPYPTRSEVWKRLADERARERLTPGLKRWIERLLAFLRRF